MILETSHESKWASLMGRRATKVALSYRLAIQQCQPERVVLGLADKMSDRMLVATLARPLTGRGGLFGWWRQHVIGSVVLLRPAEFQFKSLLSSSEAFTSTLDGSSCVGFHGSSSQRRKTRSTSKNCLCKLANQRHCQSPVLNQSSS